MHRFRAGPLALLPPAEGGRGRLLLARARCHAIFLTGRHEAQRAATERNLRAIDCGEYAALIGKPAEFNGTSAAFETGERRRVAAEGWRIIANLGDQESDLAGGCAERTFKLPGPFLLTP